MVAIIPVAIVVVKALAPLIADLISKHDRGEISDEEFMTQWNVMRTQLNAGNAAWEAAAKKEK